ncbi:hypothetical protein [Marinobacter sp. ANT_B65]|uniref:hypothetical protein n=1 Tax=Marinobacter sp. ANT_B65 TaxID=2039467 RepID=UPI000BBE5AF0|nr:hypothetical protein [Marinobacter sp. ANT_B65]PCM45665.1 hypothetical protein CPA50_06740 [Marinobacter sp. ANT_B65]
MINTIVDSGLPRLAWIASIKKASLSITIFHGADVEVADNFIVEGVWEGDFKLGKFHSAETFFGSGVSINKDGIWIVPSTGLVDRVFFCEDENNYFASNSLVCFLAYLGADLDNAHNYKKQSDNILMGVDDYDRYFPVLHQEIKSLEQIFYNPLKLTKNGIEYQSKNSDSHFSDYSSYYNTLRKNLKAIRANSKSPDRKKTLLAYTTISRGYDSTAVTALIHDLDISKAYTSHKSSSGFASWMNPKATIDDGTEIAKELGLEVSYLDYSSNEIGSDETKFICPTPAEPEIIFYKAYQEISNNDIPAIVFTGYHGDKIWNRNLGSKSLKRNIIRGDTSGLNLGEVRLESGFINVPIPFMFAREISLIHSISNSDEMSPWSIGGDYDRPIPRRIVEDKNISREAFGNRKKTVISFYSYPKNKELRNAFYAFLKNNYGIGKFNLLSTYYFDNLLYYSEKTLKLLASKLGASITPTITKDSLDISYKMFLWSIKHEVEKRKNILNHKRSDDEKYNQKIIKNNH